MAGSGQEARRTSHVLGTSSHDNSIFMSPSDVCMVTACAHSGRGEPPSTPTTLTIRMGPLGAVSNWPLGAASDGAGSPPWALLPGSGSDAAVLAMNAT